VSTFWLLLCNRYICSSFTCFFFHSIASFLLNYPYPSLSVPHHCFFHNIVLYCIRRLQLFFHFIFFFSSWHVCFVYSVVLFYLVSCWHFFFHNFPLIYRHALAPQQQLKKSPSILTFIFSLSLVKNTHSGRRRCWKLNEWFVFVFHLTKHTHTRRHSRRIFKKTNLFFLFISISLCYFSSFATRFGELSSYIPWLTSQVIC